MFKGVFFVKACNLHEGMLSEFLLSSIISPARSFVFQSFVDGLIVCKDFRLSDIGEAVGTARLKARGRSAPSAID